MKNAWVLVGATAFGLNDSIATPYGGASAGLQAHAQIITALIDGRTPYTPRATPAVQAAAALLGVLTLVGLSLYRRRFPVYLLPVGALAWAGLLWAGHAFLLLQHALWIGWAAPAVLIFVAGGSVMGVVEHAKSRIDRDRLYTHLSSYLPVPVAASLALQPPTVPSRPAPSQVSVMLPTFATSRPTAKHACPRRRVRRSLHAFFSTAARLAEAHAGVIEAFQGDAIVAVWNGDPTPDTNANDDKGGGASPAYHAQRALDAAVALLAAMQGVLPDPAPAGLEPLSLGLGVETGPAMAGSFGLANAAALAAGDGAHGYHCQPFGRNDGRAGTSHPRW